MNEIFARFMAGEAPPPRGRFFRLKYWLLIKLFAAGEWAGRRINTSKELTPLEQLYLACKVSKCDPATLRKKLELANSVVLEGMAKYASAKAKKDGVVQ